MSSNLERTFETRWRQLNGPELESEYRFARAAIGWPRVGIRAELKECGLKDWRFDFALPEKKIAIELEGGTWTNGRHTRGAGFAADCEKYNAAARFGWRLFRLTTDMIENDPLKHLEPIIREALQ